MKHLSLYLLGLMLSFSSIALSAPTEEPKVYKADRELLTQLIENSTCMASAEHLQYCLRAANDMLRYASNKNIHLLSTRQLNEYWQIYSPEKDKAYFQQGHLVMAELSDKGIEYISGTDPEGYQRSVTFRLELDKRYENLINEQITPEDLAAAFDIATKSMKKDDDVRSMISLLLTAQVRELNKDPYARVFITEERPKSTPNDGARLLWSKDKFLFKRIKPESPYDLKGLYVGSRLEKIGTEIPNPKNINKLVEMQKADKSLLTEVHSPRGEIFRLPPNEPSQFNGTHHYFMNLWGKKIAVLEIKSFSIDGICESVRTALKDINAKNSQALIVDLRDNGGGLLTAMTCITGLIFGKDLLIGTEEHLKTFYYSREKDGKPLPPVEIRSSEDKILNADIKVSVLVDAASASASEVFSGFAKYGLKNVWVVGQRTFGKGIGQLTTPVELNHKIVENMSITTTTIRMHMPNGLTYHIAGIEPDFKVDAPIKSLTDNPYISRFKDYYGEAFLPKSSDRKTKIDSQREKSKKALEKCTLPLDKKEIKDPQLWRWLEDQQLRKAAFVSYCQVNP